MGLRRSTPCVAVEARGDRGTDDAVRVDVEPRGGNEALTPRPRKSRRFMREHLSGGYAVRVCLSLRFTCSQHDAGGGASLKAFRRRRARQWKIASARTSMLSLGGRYWGRGSVKALCGAR